MASSFPQSTSPDWLIQHSLDGAPLVSVARAPRGYLVRAHEVADFEISRTGILLSTSPCEGVGDEEVTGNFEMLVQPRLFQLQGRPALHASAVTIAELGGAVAFVGAPCTGKSTMAALLAQTERLLADDHVPLERDGDQTQAFWVVPTARRVRLRNDTAPRFGVAPRDWAKPSLDVPHSTERSKLLAILQLGPGSPSPTIEPISKREAVLALAPQLHRLDPTDPELLGAELTWLDHLTHAVPMARLSYPRTFSGGAEIGAAITRYLKGST